MCRDSGYQSHWRECGGDGIDLIFERLDMGSSVWGIIARQGCRSYPPRAPPEVTNTPSTTLSTSFLPYLIRSFSSKSFLIHSASPFSTLFDNAWWNSAWAGATTFALAPTCKDLVHLAFASEPDPIMRWMCPDESWAVSNKSGMEF